MYRLSSAAVLMVVLILLASGCGGKGPQTTYNPAKDRIESLANLPPETELPSGGVTPNLIPMIDAATLAAANLEAVTVKTAARAFYVEHPSSSVFSSDVLAPYSSGTLKARYFLNTPGCSIVRVETQANGWKGMVFSISRQKWTDGSPDNDRPNDSDIP